MKRVIMSLVVCTLVLTSFVAGSILWRPAKADITTELATRIYTIEFDDWVLVYTNSQLQTSNPDYNVRITKEPIGNSSVRFHVIGGYANTPAGIKWYETTGSKLRDRLDTMCRPWKSEGENITANDFEIDIKKLN
jgi:hypothetical protein